MNALPQKEIEEKTPGSSDELQKGKSVDKPPSLPSPGIAGEGKAEVNPYSDVKRSDELQSQSRPAVAAARAPAMVVVPQIAPVATGVDDLDARVGRAMQKAADAILAGFKNGELAQEIGEGPVHRAGLHALCVYALLQAGEALDDDRLSIKGKIVPQMIEVMKSHKLEGDDVTAVTRPATTPATPKTYAHSLRAAALAVYDRAEDRKALQADVKWLVAAQHGGAYDYGERNADSDLLDVWDNSNSQYGLLGVWAGAEVGVEVSDKYWLAVEGHWKRTQQPDGRWEYSNTPNRPTPSSLSMTCGGLASLLVTYDYLDVPQLQGAVGREPYPGQIGSALRWLETGDNVIDKPRNGIWWGYNLYSVERVGLASGLKFFGTHDWYRELGQLIMSYQFPDGSIGKSDSEEDTLMNTAYSLLFLARGRHPVMMEKLRFERYWNNRPRDLSNLTKYASREMERQLNWQVVSADRPWQDWFDSPVLLIASHMAPQLSEKDYANLRRFVEAGGLILTQTDGASDAFNKWVPELVRKVCPNYELEQLAPTNLLFTTDYKITAPPKMLGVSNGSRLLVVHSPVDLSAAWQRRQRLTQKAWFELGINVFAYASGKRDIRNRVASLVVPEPTREASSKVRLARVKYSGNWDPEPYAWQRLSKKMQNDSGVALDIQPVAADAMASESAPLAFLTGTAKWTFNDAQCEALAGYVKAGGVLLIDSTGGQEAFAKSVEQDLLPRAFGGVKLTAMGEDDPVMKEVKLALRPYAVNVMAKPPALQATKAGEGYVIFTPIDVSSGLLGTSTWGIVGYTPSTCEQMVRNLVAWSTTVRQGG
jgi:hypothetical protein